MIPAIQHFACRQAGRILMCCVYPWAGLRFAFDMFR